VPLSAYLVGRSSLDILLVIAGVAMLLHFALCLIVRRSVAGDRAIEDELFAVPNRWAGAPDLIRLLRVRYFLPFWPLPQSARLLDPTIRATLLAARIAGLCFLCASLGCFVAANTEAGR
jgi:hypothetical protein